MESRELEKEELEALEKKELIFQEGLPLQKSVIVDISGGGVRFVSNHRYEPDTIIYLTYKLMIAGKEKAYEIAGKILATKPIENRPGEYEHRVQYLNMNNLEREEIIRYIFEEERKSRRKENGL